MTSDKLSSGNAIIDAMATILWGSAWADAYEEAGGSLSGMKIEDVMPPVPMAAIVDAARLAGQIEQMNDRNIHVLLYAAASADAKERGGNADDLFHDDDYTQLFGECLAWQSTGNGVSWFDDHAKFDMNLPLFEASSTREEAEAAVAAELGDRPGF